MSIRRDYYEVLGVERTADDVTIKKAFRRLALEYHPDRNSSPEAADRFREAQEAYDILSDVSKRQMYDQFGHAGVHGNAGGAGYSNMEDIFGGFQTIFEDFFGGSRQNARGADLLYRLEIEFREAVLGTKKTVTIRRSENCETCKGTGAAEGTQPESCPLCRGRGKVSRNQGFFVVSQTCPQCSGRGQVIKNPCKDCDGAGRTVRNHEIEVNIPAGVDTGVRLRISQEGELAEIGQQRGDLFVELTVQPDPQFERDGSDLYTHLHISYPTAVLGGEVEVPLIEGTKMVKIPSLMKSPYRAVLKNEGVKDLRRNRRGDLIVEMHIDTPEELTDESRELIEKLAEVFEKSKPKSDEPKKKKKKGFFH